MDLLTLFRYLPRLEQQLQRSYNAQQRGAPAIFAPYLDTLAEFTLRGGKRFRATLVLAGYHIASGRTPTPALPAAAALEHFQSWMLIHDDIIDHANQRRGGPTVHRSMEASHRAAGGLGSAAEYGIGIGITLGDLQEPFTVEALLATRAPLPARFAALQEYVRMTRETAYGQLLDIRNGSIPPGDVSEEDVLLVHRLKSAVYTVVSPLKIGALLGGGGNALLNDLERIGTDLGIAFQLRDDVLGTGFGAEQAGKSANDLLEGKRTLLVIRAWQATDETGRVSLGQALGNPHASPEEVDRARDVIRSSGSLAYSETMIGALVDRALRRIDRSRALRSSTKPLLRQVADRLVNRST